MKATELLQAIVINRYNSLDHYDSVNLKNSSKLFIKCSLAMVDTLLGGKSAEDFFADATSDNVKSMTVDKLANNIRNAELSKSEVESITEFLNALNSFTYSKEPSARTSARTRTRTRENITITPLLVGKKIFNALKAVEPCEKVVTDTPVVEPCEEVKEVVVNNLVNVTTPPSTSVATKPVGENVSNLFSSITLTGVTSFVARGTWNFVSSAAQPYFTAYMKPIVADSVPNGFKLSDTFTIEDRSSREGSGEEEKKEEIEVEVEKEEKEKEQDKVVVDNKDIDETEHEQPKLQDGSGVEVEEEDNSKFISFDSSSSSSEEGQGSVEEKGQDMGNIEAEKEVEEVKEELEAKKQGNPEDNKEQSSLDSEQPDLKTLNSFKLSDTFTIEDRSSGEGSGEEEKKEEIEVEKEEKEKEQDKVVVDNKDIDETEHEQPKLQDGSGVEVEEKSEQKTSLDQQLEGLSHREDISEVQMETQSKPAIENAINSDLHTQNLMSKQAYESSEEEREEDNSIFISFSTSSEEELELVKVVEELAVKKQKNPKDNKEQSSLGSEQPDLKTLDKIADKLLEEQKQAGLIPPPSRPLTPEEQRKLEEELKAKKLELERQKEERRVQDSINSAEEKSTSEEDKREEKKEKVVEEKKAPPSTPRDYLGMAVKLLLVGITIYNAPMVYRRDINIGETSCLRKLEVASYTIPQKLLDRNFGNDASYGAAVMLSCFFAQSSSPLWLFAMAAPAAYVNYTAENEMPSIAYGAILGAYALGRSIEWYCREDVAKEPGR